MRPRACLALICSAMVRYAAGAQEFPVYEAPMALQWPQLDGRLEAGVWRSAPVISDLVTNRDHKPAQFKTEFRFLYDKDALYVFVTAYEPDLDHLKVGKDPDNIWWDDCIEIFVDPQATRLRYFQYIINAQATLSSSYGGDFSADVPGEAAAGRTKDGWTLEVKMPFSAFGAAPHVGERWGLNVTRGRTAKAPGEERENSLWSPTDAMHGSPGRFGYILFAPASGVKPPRHEPDLATTDRLLARIGQELHGNWRWTFADVNFEARNRRAERLIALNAVLARFPDADLLYFVRPAIRDEHVLPWTVPEPNEVGGQLELVACRGELESVSLSLFATRDAKDVRFEFSELTSASGAVLPAAVADPYHVKCWYQSGVGTIHPSRTTLLAELLVKDRALITVDPKSRTNRLNFDPIPTDAQALQPIDIPAFESRQAWITYRIPRDAKSGRYAGTIAIHDKNGLVASVPVRLRVPEWDLARSPMIHGLYYGRRMPPIKTVEQEQAFFKLVEAELRDQIEHGCNAVATYIHTAPLPSDPSPWATAQRINDIQKKYGVTGTPYFGVVDHVGFQQGEEQLAEVTERARLLSQWARKNGREGFCFQGRDEASGERLRSQRPSWEAARKGGGKMWVACRASYFKDMGDILDFPVVSGRLRPDLARKVHANGFKILSYGNPQVGVELPALYRRNYGLALLAAAYDGAMNFQYGSMAGKAAYDDFDGGSYRDHNFAHPAVGKPIDTIQFEGWREAIDDIRYATTLQNAVSAALAADRHRDSAAESRAWLAGITGFEDLDAVRAEMIRRIDQLTSKADAE